MPRVLPSQPTGCPLLKSCTGGPRAEAPHWPSVVKFRKHVIAARLVTRRHLSRLRRRWIPTSSYSYQSVTNDRQRDGAPHGCPRGSSYGSPLLIPALAARYRPTAQPWEYGRSFTACIRWVWRLCSGPTYRDPGRDFFIPGGENLRAVTKPVTHSVLL